MISFDYLANYYVVYVVNMHDDSLLFPSVSLQTAFKQSYNVVVQLVRRCGAVRARCLFST